MTEPKVAFIAPAANKGLISYGKSANSHSIGGVAYLMNADTFFGVSCNNYKKMEQYDYIVITQATTLYRLTRELRENLPSKVKIINFADGAYQDLTRIPFMPDGGILLIKALQVADGFGSLVEDAVDYYSLFTDKPCCFLGVPFPYEEVKKFQIPSEQKHKLVGINGQLTNAPVRNSIGSLFLIKKVEGVQALLCEPESDKIAPFLFENNLSVEMHKPLDYDTFYERYSKCYLGINLDPLGSWGRFSLDLAGLGIPVIGTPIQHTQKKLFPQLTFDPFLEVSKIISAYQRLFSDLNFYNECRERALNIIQTEFTDEKFISRWDELRRRVENG